MLRGANIALLAILASLVSCGGEEPKVNVLLIVMDTVRYDALSARYGDQSLTPNIDSLAEEGVTFSRTFSTAPWTLPSHGSIFTGLFPFQHHAVMSNLYLSSSFITLAEAFKSADYRTAGFSCNPWIARMTQMDQGFDLFEELFKGERPFSGSTETTEKAIHWMTEGSRTKPFFLFINYINAHLPYSPPEDFIAGLFTENAPGPNRRTFSIEEYEEVMVGKKNLTAEDLKEIRQLYDAEIRHVDDQLGRLFKTLKEKALLDETVVIITSDHGEHMGENSFLGHDFSIHHALIRVPLVIRFPAHFPGGRTVKTNVSLVDIYPTLISVTGLNPSLLAGLPGRNLLTLIDGPAADEKDAFLAEYHKPRQLIQSYWQPRHPEYDFSKWNLGYKVLIRGPYKFVFRDDGQEYLYDLEADPGEEKNLAADKPAFCKTFREQLFEILRKEGRTLREETILPDEETREKLHALGYL